MSSPITENGLWNLRDAYRARNESRYPGGQYNIELLLVGGGGQGGGWFGGGGGGFDEQPIGGGGGSGFDEQPLGGARGGGYNLDNLDESAFGGPMPGSKPRKAPPARLAKKT